MVSILSPMGEVTDIDVSRLPMTLSARRLPCLPAKGLDDELRAIPAGDEPHLPNTLDLEPPHLPTTSRAGMSVPWLGLSGNVSYGTVPGNVLGGINDISQGELLCRKPR